MAGAQVAPVLRALGNERRLMIVCKLAEWGEATVTALADAIGVSPSVLSQHMAKLRERGIVDYRRDSQTLWYRISDPRIEKLFATLHALFCPTQGNKAPTRAERKPRRGSL